MATISGFTPILNPTRKTDKEKGLISSTLQKIKNIFGKKEEHSSSSTFQSFSHNGKLVTQERAEELATFFDAVSGPGGNSLLPKFQGTLAEKAKAMLEWFDGNGPQKFQTISLKNKNLQSLPPEIGKFTNLMWLDLSGNQLTELPTIIGSCTNLHLLNLSNNKLAALPPQMQNLKKLSILLFSNNQISSLPLWFVALTNLDTLQILDNPIRLIPNAILSGLTKLTDFLYPNDCIISEEIKKDLKLEARINTWFNHLRGEGQTYLEIMSDLHKSHEELHKEMFAKVLDEETCIHREESILERQKNNGASELETLKLRIKELKGPDAEICQKLYERKELLTMAPMNDEERVLQEAEKKKDVERAEVVLFYKYDNDLNQLKDFSDSYGGKWTILYNQRIEGRVDEDKDKASVSYYAGYTPKIVPKTSYYSGYTPRTQTSEDPTRVSGGYHTPIRVS